MAMTNPTTTPIRETTKTSRPDSARQRNSGLTWKSTLLVTGVGITLLGHTLLTQIERTNAAAEANQLAKSTAVVQIIQVLDAASSTRAAQIAAFQQAQASQNAANSKPRTIIVRVPVSVSGTQAIANNGGSNSRGSGPSGGHISSQPNPVNPPSQASFTSAPAPAIVMPAMPKMPTAPVFQAPVTVTRKS